MKEWLRSDHKSVMIAHILFRLISRADELGPAVTASKNETVTAAESLMFETRWPGYRLLLTHIEHYSTFSLVHSQLNADQWIDGGEAIRILLDIKGADASFVVEGHEMVKPRKQIQRCMECRTTLALSGRSIDMVVNID